MSSTRQIARIATGALLVAAGGFAILVSAGPAAAATYSGYVMGYFTESPSTTGADYGLHRFVRHQNNVGRIDAYPFDPFSDQQWRVVPGLADASAVSLQSVNFPNMYLRQSNLAVVLATNDNSATFRADATFYRTAGLADANWASLRSYSNPTRYVRHYNYILRLDVLSTSSPTPDRQDATFAFTS